MLGGTFGLKSDRSQGKVYVPRSQSTSDLFQIPEVVGQDWGKRRRLTIKKSTSTGNLNSHVRRSISELQLTPYQLQRTQMKQKFQFPNGESFTPRSQLMRPRDQYSMYSNTVVIDERSDQRRAYSLSKIYRMKESQSLPSVTNGGSQLAVDSGTALPPMVTHATAPAMLSSATEYEISQDRNRWPRRSSSLYSRSRSTTAAAAAAAALSATHAMGDESSSDADAKKDYGKVETKIKRNDSVRSTGFASVTGGQVSLPKSPLVSTGTATSSVGSQQSTMTRSNLSTSGTTTSEHSEITTKVPLLIAPTVVQIDEQPGLSANPPSASEIVEPSGKIPVDNKGSEQIQLKRTRSKLGSLLKKFIPPLKRKKRALDSNLSNDANAGEGIEIKNNSPTQTILDSNGLGDDISVPSAEKTDNGLFDIDLVFDSLLLKNGGEETPVTTNNKILTGTVSNEADKETVKEEQNEERRNSITYEIDYDLIHDFSKLGHYINTGVGGNNMDDQVSSLTPPPRSNRRPIGKGAQLFRGSEERITLDKDHTQEDRILNNLQVNWKTVHINVTMPRQNCSSTSSISISSPTDSATSEKSDKSHKRLEFADDIYVNDTYSHLEYRRSDKNFLKERRQLMMSIKGLSFVHSVKAELNEYKKYEMQVHPESKQNTQLFT
ncbi:HGL101Cp [Eremothecium sinecaudum]|uniref:HGL101Cp n=1 Tax=Eremothecium sinecaudum TaxID=45286 RepID=A0A0X8HVL0_9SACH|nr:HGL101Cp [Eremothecium sinecaudum]AMD22239.1 HGL101Cp [Eremothecium sinecaudum]